uniref:Uncharacterized protein n=1 Tax=Romanomermis culicivorax TaxID=13658 RepID=A0A915HP33_ROMCU
MIDTSLTEEQQTQTYNYSLFNLIDAAGARKVAFCTTVPFQLKGITNRRNPHADADGGYGLIVRCGYG